MVIMFGGGGKLTLLTNQANASQVDEVIEGVEKRENRPIAALFCEARYELCV
jgi:hypothetical protein